MAERNSDGSYDAVDSGGFGKDYHGQDAFGERIGGTGIGGSHFGGKAAGDFSGADELGEGHFTERYTDYGQAMATESPTEVEDATEVASNMRDTLRDINNTETENSNVGSMDTSFQIGDNNEDLEKARRQMERDKMELDDFNMVAEELQSSFDKSFDSISTSDVSNIIDSIENVANAYGVDFYRKDAESRLFNGGIDALRQIEDDVLAKARSRFEAKAKASADNYDKLKSSFTDKTKPAKDKSESTPSEVMKDFFDMPEETKTKTKTKAEELNEDETAERLRQNVDLSKENVGLISKSLEKFDKTAEDLIANTNGLVDRLKSKNPLDIISNKLGTDAKEEAINIIENYSRGFGLDFDRAKLERDIKTNGPDAITEAVISMIGKGRSQFVDKLKSAEDTYNSSVAAYDSYLKSSFTDKTTKSKEKKAATPSEVMKAATSTEAKPGKNMSSAKTSPSDYLTKSNKDSTKEIAPSRNDFGNHAVDTLKGVTDRITGSTTADALGIKSIEEFARENGYNPEKLSTMKAYQSYQNKEIMKAIPGIVKQIGNYITERVKDAVDPSQLGERVRNTLARYNLATLIGAAILSIKSGAGLQASIDQALTMVDTEDQPAVSDYLEDVLSDEGTVNDLGNAFDDALAPEQNSDTNELDESIVNIGRKDNTDYSGFNAGLGSSGTTSSDADAKVFIARNVKADPILRKMISKIGK